jgi:hypothetical protein
VDGLLLEAAKQSPVLAVVLSFIWYLRSRDQVLKDISSRCHEVQDNATEAMNRNTEVVGGVIQVIQKCNGKVEEDVG